MLYKADFAFFYSLKDVVTASLAICCGGPKILFILLKKDFYFFFACRHAQSDSIHQASVFMSKIDQSLTNLIEFSTVSSQYI